MAENLADFDDALARARRGEGSAWGVLYDRVAPIVVGYLRAQSLTDPEDVAGEVFLQLVRDLDRFEGDERAFRSWVLSIAHHRMLDARRAATRRPAVPVPSDQLDPGPAPDDPAGSVMDAATLEEVLATLDTLTPEQRDVVTLRVVADLTLEETAAVVGRTVGAVKALQHRALNALRAQVRADRNPQHATDAHQV